MLKATYALNFLGHQLLEPLMVTITAVNWNIFLPTRDYILQGMDAEEMKTVFIELLEG